MHLSKWKLALVVGLTIIGSGSGTGGARAQAAIERLQPLVATSAQRLFIAERVALAKWDSGAPVEDMPREAQVIASAVRDGESRGLDPKSVSNFFKAQIEANKVVQYSLLADWRRSGRAPAHAPINLAITIRPQLDQIQRTLIAELQDTAAIRASTTCPTDVAKAVAKYLSVHKQKVGPLYAIALDRALVASCTLK
jgi:chorismate mutase